jgi:hypothetical protein
MHHRVTARERAMELARLEEALQDDRLGSLRATPTTW